MLSNTIGQPNTKEGFWEEGFAIEVRLKKKDDLESKFTGEVVNQEEPHERG